MKYSEYDRFCSFLLILGNLLEERVDNGDGKHDTGTATNGTHEIGKDAKSTDADTAEGGGDMDVPSEVLDHGFLAKTVDGHLLVHEVLDDIARCTSGHIDPYTGEESAGAHHEDAVEEAVDGILEDIGPLARRADVVSKTTNGGGMSSHVVVLPLADEADEDVALELAVKNLGKEVQVGDEGSLEDNWDVRGIEQLDWVGVGLTTGAFALECKFNTEALEVDDNEDDNDSGDQIRDIGRVLPIEGLLQCENLVLLS